MASAYPSDAIDRGLAYGKVVVRFEVDQSSLRILSMDASDPAFTTPVTGILHRFRCHTDRSTVYEIPFTFERYP